MILKTEKFFILLCYLTLSKGLFVKQGGYEDLVVQISDTVRHEDCKESLQNLKAALTTSSDYLFHALDSRAFIRSVQIILPKSWPDSCVQNLDNASEITHKLDNGLQTSSDPIIGTKIPVETMEASAGERPDITIVPYGPVGTKIWTQQSSGCENQGDQIYLTHNLLKTGDVNLGRLIVKEFAKYRYGIFDENGFDKDEVYPLCYKESEDEPMKVTSCSDKPVHDNGICSNPRMNYTLGDLVDPTAQSSIMFTPEAPSVKLFCDYRSHDRNSPTKQNFMCNRRSTLDVILQNPDFVDTYTSESRSIVNTVPKFSFKRQKLTRYILIIEDTKEMMIRESWTYLRNAIRKWVVHDLPDNTEIGLVMANETKSSKIMEITSLSRSVNRDLVASNIPYTPGDSRAASCLHCAMTKAIHMLKDRRTTHGPASSVIILIAPGMDYNQQLSDLTKDAKKSKIKIATINYPGIFRQQMLDSIAAETEGVAFTVNEIRHNVETSLLTTYFQLTNVMTSIMEEFYQGNPLDLPVEIHRRELYDDGKNSVTGSFVLDTDLGEPGRFALFTHNVDSPLIKSLTLWSPSEQQYEARSENLLSVKIITIAANLSETGTWTYKIERFSGNPQPHFIQVSATPKSRDASIVKTKFWTSYNQPGGPLVLYVEVKKQEWPVMGAKVEVTVTRPEQDGSGVYKNKFDLLDTGSGDPDVTQGDGIYTQYFSASAAGGAGMYTFDVTVRDNDKTAYAISDQDSEDLDKPCCGSDTRRLNVQPLSSFQRYLPTITKYITSDEIQSSNQLAVGRIGNLRAVYKEGQIVKLLWTAPDMGGTTVERYEIKYANSIQDITENFETQASTWKYGTAFLQSPGSETTFTMDFTKEPTLIDKPLYFAVKAFNSYSLDSGNGQISNWIRVFVPIPSPPITPTITLEEMSSPNQNQDTNDGINIKPQVENNADGITIHLILIIIFLSILAILFIVTFCFCSTKKKKLRLRKKSKKNEELSSVISPTLNGTEKSSNNTPEHNSAYVIDMNDPHTMTHTYEKDKYDDEPMKNHLSIIQQQEQQLIEELKHQQQQREFLPARNLSPYECWMASQLLREHERRIHPIIIDGDVGVDVIDDMPMSHHQQDHMLFRDHNMDKVVVNIMSPPPVPPLPDYDYSTNYDIYDVHPTEPIHPNMQNVQSNLYQTLLKNPNFVPFNSSFNDQGSMSSVTSGEKKKRNVTMV